MATLPKSQDVLGEAWGPHLNRMEGLRLDTGVQPDKIRHHCVDRIRRLSQEMPLRQPRPSFVDRE